MQSTALQTIQQPLNRQTEIAVISALLVPVLIGIVNVALVFQPAFALSTPTATENNLVALTNTERQQQGLTALSTNLKLHEAAKAKAADMLNNDYFEHTSPAGKTPWYFIDNTGYVYLRAGENLAIDFEQVEKVVPAWMDSPAHRANILKADYEEVGIAVATGEYKGRETTVIVQMFGTKPISAQNVMNSFIKTVTSPLPF